MDLKQRLFGGVLIVGMAAHGVHQIELPPWRRNEHGEENPPVQAGDMGAGIIVAARTTATSFGSIVAGEGEVKEF
jgi:hypothetical protein